MKNAKRAGLITATGFAALLFAGVATAPAMAADVQVSGNGSSISTSSHVSALDPNWGPADAELGVAVRYVNNTAESVTISASSYDESQGGFVLKPGETMWAYNAVFAGDDLNTTVTIGSSGSVTVDGKRPSWGTSWIKIAGTQVNAGNTTNVTSGAHSFNAKWDGENTQKADGVDRWTVTINS